jgi:ribosomal protein S11
MSTIYVFNQELDALTSVAVDDVALVHDTSVGSKKKATISDMRAMTVAAATTAASLDNEGVHTLSTALVTYTLAAPEPGKQVVITALAVATAQTRIVQTSTANSETFDGTNNKWVSTGVQTLHLVGVTTSRYSIISNALSGATTSVGTLSTI